jgi:hypothetical protein
VRRLLLTVAISTLVAASGCSIDGARAYRVGRTDVSQSTIDDELSVLHDYKFLASSVVQQQLGHLLQGSLPAEVTSRWLTIRITTTFAHNELARRGVRITDADRATVGLPRTRAYASLPKGFRHSLVENLAAIGALGRDVAAKNPAVQTRAADACASHRYVSHILVKTRDEADALKQQLDRGGDFAALAREKSIDTGSAAQGGRLGCSDDQQGLVEPFASVAALQPVGVVSDPVQTQFGFHLILVSDQPSPSDLQAVALTILAKELRRSDVTIDPRYGRWDRKSGQVLPPSSPSG